MRAGVTWTLLLGCLAVACASAPPPPPAAPAAEEAPPPEPKEHVDPAEEHDDAADAEVGPAAAGPTKPPPSTASFEEATSVAEEVTLGDDRLQLTDNQLNEPMRGVLRSCRVPPNVHVTIKTAVQFGRAIGVTVHVEMPKPPRPQKKTKRLSKQAAKAEAAQAKARAKTAARITTCADHAVRALSWPPSRRRDAFTTTF